MWKRNNMNIKKNLHEYQQELRSDLRFASYDYCFNYFQGFKDQGKVKQLTSKDNIQLSCLQLAFYLASWGMFRGAGFFIDKSVKFFEPVIEVIAQTERRVWDIDVDRYDKSNIEAILQCSQNIKRALGTENEPTDTQFTKIMLGVFGNVPAYDTNFRKAFGVYRLNSNSLNKIKHFYQRNDKVINECRFNTIDYSSGKHTAKKYTKAKLIDMIGFIEGRKNR